MYLNKGLMITIIIAKFANFAGAFGTAGNSGSSHSFAALANFANASGTAGNSYAASATPRLLPAHFIAGRLGQGMCEKAEWQVKRPVGLHPAATYREEVAESSPPA